VVATNTDRLTLHTLLLESLPSTIHGADEKTAKSNFIPTLQALHTKFIRYGTHKSINVLMFDHDNIKMSLQAYSTWLESKLNIKPTFITKTTNGYQFGFILNRTIWKYHSQGKNKTDEYKAQKLLKKKITLLINGDAAGSNRSIGIWRNPLEHDFIFYNRKYSLETIATKTNTTKTLFDVPLQDAAPTSENFLDDISSFNFGVEPTVKLQAINLNAKCRLSKQGTIQGSINKGFIVGNRNGFMFAIGFKIVFENRSLLSTLEEEMQQINKSHQNSLTNKEVTNIYKSIVKLVPTMHQPKREDKPKGKYFNEMQSQGVHGVYNRRAFAGHAVARDRTIATIETILKSLVSLFDAGETNPINKVVADEAQLSVRTYQRVKQYVSKSKVFLEWIISISRDTQIDIRPYVMVVLRRVFFGLKKRIDTASSKYSELREFELFQMKQKEVVT